MFILFDLFCPLWSFSVLFRALGRLCSYSVHICLIQSILSTSVLSSIHWSYSILFSPISFYSVHYVYFDPNLSTHSYLVHLVLIWSNSIHLVPIWSNTVHLYPLGSLLVHFYALAYREKTCLG